MIWVPMNILGMCFLSIDFGNLFVRLPLYLYFQESQNAILLSFNRELNPWDFIITLPEQQSSASAPPFQIIHTASLHLFQNFLCGLNINVSQSTRCWYSNQSSINLCADSAINCFEMGFTTTHKFYKFQSVLSYSAASFINLSCTIKCLFNWDTVFTQR